MTPALGHHIPRVQLRLVCSWFQTLCTISTCDADVATFLVSFRNSNGLHILLYSLQVDPDSVKYKDKAREKQRQKVCVMSCNIMEGVEGAGDHGVLREPCACVHRKCKAFTTPPPQCPPLHHTLSTSSRHNITTLL